MQPLTPDLARQLRLGANERGLVVGAVDPNSDAGQKGIRPGDVILSINQTPVTTPEAAASVVETARRANRNTVLLQIRRGSGPPGYVGVELSRAAVAPPARRPG